MTVTETVALTGICFFAITWLETKVTKKTLGGLLILAFILILVLGKKFS